MKVPDRFEKPPVFGVVQAAILLAVLFATSSAVTLTIAKISTTLDNQEEQNEARVAARDWSQIIGSGRVLTQNALSVVEGIFAHSGHHEADDLHLPLFPNCTRRSLPDSFGSDQPHLLLNADNVDRYGPVLEAMSDRVVDDIIRAVAFLPGGLFVPALLAGPPSFTTPLELGLAQRYGGGDDTGGNEYSCDVVSAHITTSGWSDTQMTPVFYGGSMSFPMRPIFTVPSSKLTPNDRCKRFVGFAATGFNITRIWEKASQFLYANHPNYDLIVKRSKGSPFVYIRNRTTHDTIVNEGVAIPTTVGNLQTIYMYPHGGFTMFSTKLIVTCLLGSAIVSLVVVLIVTVTSCVAERVQVQRREAKARRVPRHAPFAIIATEIHNAKAAWRSHPKEMGEALRKVNEELRTLASSHDVFETRLINDGAVFVAQSPTSAVAFASAVSSWSASTTWPKSLIGKESDRQNDRFENDDHHAHSLSVKIAAHWCKDARIRADPHDRFKIDVLGDDALLGTALRRAAPLSSPLVTGALCSALNVQFREYGQNHSSPAGSDFSVDMSLNPLHPSGLHCPDVGQRLPNRQTSQRGLGTVVHGPLRETVFVPLGMTPWRQELITGFVAVPRAIVARKYPPLTHTRSTSAAELNSLAASSDPAGLQNFASVATQTVSPRTHINRVAPDPLRGDIHEPKLSEDPVSDKSSCLCRVLGHLELKALRPYWQAPTAARPGLHLSGPTATDGLDAQLSDAEAIKDNYAADWLPARACAWPVAKAMIDAKEGYASQVPLAQHLVVLTIGTFFYQAYTLAFSPLEGSEQRAVFRRLQVVFGIPERRFLPHLALRCGAICWQQLYGERVGSRQQSTVSNSLSASFFNSSTNRRDARSLCQ